MPKVHVIMRHLHKYCSNKDGKKEIQNITRKVDPVLPSEELFDESGNNLAKHEVDAKWVAKNKENIIFHIKRASKSYESKKEKDTPLGLLEAALKKLTHEDMDLREISVGDYKKARELAANIQREAKQLESQIYQQIKKYKDLENKN